MFNPQLENIEWREVYRGAHEVLPNYSGIKWEKTHLIDLKKGELFKLIDPDGTQVEHEDGRKEFIAKTNGYVNELGIPEIEIY
jgi:hypothetical protein